MRRKVKELLDNKFKQLLKNFSFTFLANVISVLISTLLVFVLSKSMSVTQYGYWQLYILYSNYISFFHFGIADGYYLRNSGSLYEELDKKRFSFMFWFILILEILLAIIVAGVYMLIVSKSTADPPTNPLNHFVLLMNCIAAILIIPRVFIQFAWQASNKFKWNAIIIIVERAFFLLSVLFFLFNRYSHVNNLIYLDLTGKFLALILAVLMAKNLVFTKPTRLRIGLEELRLNATVGISLMLASITSNLIIGLIQLNIKRQWGVDTYSRIALTFSLSNLLMIFINALALVLLPHIRKQESADNARLYKNMRKTLMLILFVVLNAYYPFRLFVNYWLPDYAAGIVYMSILFPICVYESKTQLLTNTYLKAYRKEREILKANLLSLGLAAVLMFGFAIILQNLFLTTLSILIVLAFRSFICEIYLAKETHQNYLPDNLIELLLTAIFVLSQWFIGGWLGALLYLVFSAIFLYLNKSTLATLYARGKEKLKRS